ncbi:MAG: hypothetical protein Q9191_001944 [Dirinaria sp. TL-2023a]
MTTEPHSQIANEAQTSIRTFAKLEDLLKDTLQEPYHGLSRDAILDEFARFNIWATNIKALQPHNKRSSLGARLKDAPKVAQLVAENLKDLNETLNDLTSIVSGQRENRIISPRDEVQLSPQEIDELVALGLVDPDDLEPFSESSKLFKYCIEFVTNLYGLSLLIQKSTNRDRYSKALSTRGDPFNEQPDILHVEHKFPKLKQSPWLVERLGAAAAKRRHFLRYCRTHHEDDESIRTMSMKIVPKPVTDLERSKPTPSRPPLLAQIAEAQTSRPSQIETETSKATTFVMSKFEDLEQGGEPELDEQSLGSYATTVVESSNADLHVPPIPEEAATGPFLCPYCHTAQQCRRRRVWKKHVFNDLRPYLCTAPDCGLKLFIDRNSWQKHEFESHWVEWCCRYCSHRPFTLREHLESHMRTRHETSLTEVQLPYVLDIARRPVEAIAPSSCAFCDEWENTLVRLNPENEGEKVLVTPNQYREHVALHMEQLALFALPRGRMDADEDVDSTGANPGAESSLKVEDDFPDASTSAQPDPALHVDAYEGKGVEVLRRLKAGENVNASGRTWGSALGAAVAGGQPAVAKLLLDYGADVYMRCHYFETAVDASRVVQNDTMRQILLEGKGNEQRAEHHASFKRQLEEAAETIDHTCTFAKEFKVPAPQFEHLQITDETLRGIGKDIRKCASIIEVDSKNRNQAIDTGWQALGLLKMTTTVLCDYFQLLAQSFGIHDRDFRPDYRDYTKEQYAFWSKLDDIFKTPEQHSEQNIMDVFLEFSGFVSIITACIDEKRTCNSASDLPTRAERHYDKLHNTIKDLAVIYPDILGTVMSIIDIRRETNALKHSGDARDSKPDTMGGISIHEKDSPHASRTSSITSGGEQQRLEAGSQLDVNALSIFEEFNTSASVNEKVWQWAEIQSSEKMSNSSSLNVPDTTVDSSSMAPSMHESTSMTTNTKGEEAGRVRTQADEKAEALEFMETMSSMVKPVLEALSRFKAKIPADAQEILAQQSDLFDQVQKYSDAIDGWYQDINDTPLSPDKFEPSESLKDDEISQTLHKVLGIVCGYTERLILIALEDQEHWTAETCVEKWHRIADQFEWETGWPLAGAFKFLLQDEQVQSEFYDRTKHALRAPERLLERRRLLDAAHTSGSSTPRTSEAGTAKAPAEGS